MNDLRREPFRALFPLGALFGIIGVGHWFLYAAHLSSASSSYFHASMQVGAFMFCFISGFLLTALPRFSQTAPASNAELARVIIFLLGQAVFLLLGWFAAAEACFIGLLICLIQFAGKRFAQKKTEVSPPPAFAWIPIALLHGIIGGFLVLLNQLGWAPAWALATGRPMMQQGFLLGMVLGVGGFLTPRLMGRTELFNKPSGADSTAAALHQKKREAVVHELAGGAFFLTFVVEGIGRVQSAYLLRALIVTVNLAWTTHFYRRPNVRDGYVMLTWFSLWAACLGLWGAGAWPRYRIGMLHITFLGGFSLMVFAVATMVVLSHGGEGPRLQKPLLILRLAGFGIAAAIALRLAAEFIPDQYFKLLGAASLVWMAVAACWAAFALPRVTRAAPEEEFEQLHEAAKQRLRVV